MNILILYMDKGASPANTQPELAAALDRGLKDQHSVLNFATK